MGNPGHSRKTTCFDCCGSYSKYLGSLPRMLTVGDNLKHPKSNCRLGHSMHRAAVVFLRRDTGPLGVLQSHRFIGREFPNGTFHR